MVWAFKIVFFFKLFFYFSFRTTYANARFKLDKAYSVCFDGKLFVKKIIFLTSHPKTLFIFIVHFVLLSLSLSLLISKKIYIQKETSKKHKAEQRVQRGKQIKEKRNRKNKKTNEANKELITKKRTKEYRDRITRGEFSSPRPIKKRATKISE